MPLVDHLEYAREVRGRLAHTQPYQPEGGTLVEQDQHDDPLVDQRDVEVLSVSLVHERREPSLADELRYGVRGGHIARRERRQGRGVETLDLIPRGGYLLSVAVDQEGGPGVGVLSE